MKTTVNLKNAALIALLGAALATPVWAQPGPGPGGGPGVQSSAPGPGPGKGRGMRFSQYNTPGWKLMTPEEQAAHREKMLSAKSYDECKTLQAEHRTTMEARAKEQGTTLPVPRQNGCDRMKARGLIK